MWNVDPHQLPALDGGELGMFTSLFSIFYLFFFPPTHFKVQDMMLHVCTQEEGLEFQHVLHLFNLHKNILSKINDKCCL